MIGLDNRRSAAKTLVNKMGLNTVHKGYFCYLTYLIIAGLHHILSLHFTVFILINTESFCASEMN